MMCLPFAHIAGIPIEETLAPIIPALVVAVGAAVATLRARLRRLWTSATHDAGEAGTPRAAPQTETITRTTQAAAGSAHRGHPRPES